MKSTIPHWWPQKPVRVTQRSITPLIILIIGVITTSVFSVYLSEVAKNREELQFNNLADLAQNTISNRLDTYIALLRGGQAMLTVDNTVTNAEFDAFTSDLDLQGRYSGVQGVGFAELRKNSNGNITVPILFLTPLDEKNSNALGFDMFSEQVRRAAMETAIDTADAQATGKLSFVKEINSDLQAGFLIYHPLYNFGSNPLTLEVRRRDIRGFLYSPFKTDDLFKGMLGSELYPGVEFSVYDGEKVDSDTLLYTSQDFVDPVRKYTSTRTVAIAGRTWTIFFFSTRQFQIAWERSILPIVLFVGLTTTFLLYILSRLQFKSWQNAEKTSARLRRSEAQFRLVVENATDLIQVIDLEGKYVYISPSHRKVVGYSGKELIGKYGRNYIHPDDRQIVEKQFRKVLQGKEGSAMFRFRSKKGNYVYLDGIASILYDDNGLPLTAVSICRDITSRLEIEKRKDEFIAIASHELKTPVTSLKAYTQVLLKRFQRKGDLEAAGSLTKMDGQLNKLTKLIGDLLDVTKIEAGKLQLNIEKFDLDDLINEIVESTQLTTESHTLLVVGEIKTKIISDRERVGQVITNLLTNAIKYSPNADKVIINLSDKEGHVVISVQDFGVGIHKSKIGSIFERFFRVNGPTEQTFSGLGLGLYISSEIVKRLGGEIWAESKVGKGSEFFFTLPLEKKTVKR